MSWDNFGETYGRVPLGMKIMGPIGFGTIGFWLARSVNRRIRAHEAYTESLKRYSEELEARNLSLTELNETLDSLVYTASHDLKTPVVNFKGLLNMLKMVKDRPDSGAVVNEVIGKLELASDRFMVTIDDLLDVSRIAQKIEEEKERIEIHKMVEEVLQDLEELIAQMKGKVEVDTFTAPAILMPRHDLRSILQNLIGNALRYTRQDRLPAIRISSELQKDQLRITIADNGRGIDLKQHGEKLFKMFSRLHDGTGGNGVGLYIVKRTMDKIGGSIDVESEPGEGTIFQLSFPSNCIP